MDNFEAVWEMSGSLIREAARTIQQVGAGTDRCCQEERGVAYGLLLQAREWLMSSPVDIAVTYNERYGEHEFPRNVIGHDYPEINRQVEAFSLQVPSKQYTQLIDMHNLCMAALDDMHEQGYTVDETDRPIGAAFFLSSLPRVSTMVHVLACMMLLICNPLLGTQEARADRPMAVTAESVVQDWTEDTLASLPPNSRVAVGQMTWPNATPLPGRLQSADHIQRALIAKLKASGVTIVEQHEAHDRLFFGVIGDRRTLASAVLFQVVPSGKLTVASRVHVAMPVWGQSDPYVGWSRYLGDLSWNVAAGLMANKVTRVTLPVSPIDLEGQEIPGGSNSVFRMTWPLIVQALHEFGIETYMPGPNAPLTSLALSVEWPTATTVDAKGHPLEIVRGATAHVWSVSTRGPKTYQAGPVSMPLPWPAGVKPVNRVSQLPNYPLFIPYEWAADAQRSVVRLRFNDDLEREDREATARLNQFGAESLAHHRRESQAMLADATTRIVASHKTAVADLKDTWSKSPSQEVPRNIRENAAQIRRHNEQLHKKLELLGITGIERVRPYPHG